MGNYQGRPKQGTITEADRAVLSLKTQRRTLTGERKRLEAALDRELSVARQLVAAGKKDRALLALKKRKLQEQQLTRLDVWLLNVEQLLSNIESAKQQNRLFEALKSGSDAVKEMQKEVSVEDFEALMEDSADAQAYQDRMNEALGQSLSPEAGEEAEAELKVMEADYERLEAAEKLPSVPQHVVIVKEGMSSVPAHAVEKQAEEKQAEGPMLA